MWAPLAGAQSNLGELLDAGAKALSAEQFREEVVQRALSGPLPRVGSVDVMYASNGVVTGTGTHPNFTGIPLAEFTGTWTIDDNGRICVRNNVGSTPLPSRCQFWFKLGDKYFLSDSDTDRRTRVLVRMLKQ